jgi:hypothetical protein
VALSYSGRQDLTLAIQEIARLAAAGHLTPAEVTPELIAAHLATRQLPPAWQQPDLVVRTSGEQRMSNFMCWEAAYSGGWGAGDGRAWVGLQGLQGLQARAAQQRSRLAAAEHWARRPDGLATQGCPPTNPRCACCACRAVL